MNKNYFDNTLNYNTKKIIINLLIINHYKNYISHTLLNNTTIDEILKLILSTFLLFNFLNLKK